LNSEGFNSHSPIKKPFLSKKHIESRFEIAKSWLKYSKEEYKTIIFSGEVNSIYITLMAKGLYGETTRMALKTNICALPLSMEEDPLWRGQSKTP